MITFLVVLSSILTVTSVIPYLIGVVQGKTKPRIVSWFTWTLLTGVACVATLADKQYPAAILLAFGSLMTLLVVILGWRYGDRRFERFDMVCQAGVLVGLALWLIFNSPAVAIVATVVIDLVGALPTLRHSWQKPYEETWLTFGLSGLGSLCTVLAVESWTITAVLFPLYLTCVNLLTASIIVARHKYAIPGEPAQLREL